jgi:hypothetical protein
MINADQPRILHITGNALVMQESMENPTPTAGLQFDDPEVLDGPTGPMESMGLLCFLEK